MSNPGNNFNHTNSILPVIECFPYAAPEIGFFFPNSVALMANFAIKGGLVAKYAFIETYL